MILRPGLFGRHFPNFRRIDCLCPGQEINVPSFHQARWGGLSSPRQATKGYLVALSSIVSRKVMSDNPLLIKILAPPTIQSTLTIWSVALCFILATLTHYVQGRNFALNPSEGLKISAFKDCHTTRAMQDRELVSLSKYLTHIAASGIGFQSFEHKVCDLSILHTCVPHISTRTGRESFLG